MRQYKDATYEQVGKLQVYLSEEEEIALLNEYKGEKEKLYGYVLDEEKCRRWFLTKYRELKNNGRSIAKLSNSYNPRETGFNDKLKEKLDLELQNATVTNCKDTLFNLDLSYECYMEMLKLIRPTAKLDVIIDRIKQIEERLLYSLLMAGQSIAKQYAVNLLHLEEADASQEINMYLLGSIRKYNPEYRTAAGNRVKLCTYAYGRAEDLLQEWLLTNSRLVRLPRSKMERILIIIRASKALIYDETNLVDLMSEANIILETRKGKLSNNNLFTVKEVDELIALLLGNSISVDRPMFHHGNHQHPMTIGDMIPTEIPSAVDSIVTHSNKKKLIHTMKKELTELEYQIIMLRYFHDTTAKIPKAFSEVSVLLMSEYGIKECSRELIRQVEKAALNKLSKLKGLKTLCLS